MTYQFQMLDYFLYTMLIIGVGLGGGLMLYNWIRGRAECTINSRST